MKTVVCFGDSNTWGATPDDRSRHPFEVRWTGILQKALGAEYQIVEQGLGGRTTAFDDPLSPDRNGLRYLPIVLETHSPIDLLVIMLGTNDLKARLNQSAYGIAKGVEKLIEFAQDFETPPGKILLVCPAQPVASDDEEIVLMFEGAHEKAAELPKYYRRVAERTNVEFFNAGEACSSSPVDGIHLDAKAHLLLGKGIADCVRNIIG